MAQAWGKDVGLYPQNSEKSLKHLKQEKEMLTLFCFVLFLMVVAAR